MNSTCRILKTVSLHAICQIWLLESRIYHGDFSRFSIPSYYTTFLSRGPSRAHRSDLALQDATFGKALSLDSDSPCFTFHFRLNPCVPQGFEKDSAGERSRVGCIEAPEEQMDLVKNLLLSQLNLVVSHVKLINLTVQDRCYYSALWNLRGLLSISERLQNPEGKK